MKQIKYSMVVWKDVAEIAIPIFELGNYDHIIITKIFLNVPGLNG